MTLPFDEKLTLLRNLTYLTRSLEVPLHEPCVFIMIHSYCVIYKLFAHVWVFTYCMHAIIVGVRIVLQLKEMWVVNAAEATDVKIREECQPGKPIPVFSETAHKVACVYCIILV